MSTVCVGWGGSNCHSMFFNTALHEKNDSEFIQQNISTPMIGSPHCCKLLWKGGESGFKDLILLWKLLLFDHAFLMLYKSMQISCYIEKSKNPMLQLICLNISKNETFKIFRIFKKYSETVNRTPWRTMFEWSSSVVSGEGLLYQSLAGM